MKKTALFVIPAAAVLLILCLLLGSYAAFGTANFIRVTGALVSLSKGDVNHYEISAAPNRIVIAAPDNAYQTMVETLEAEGYQIHEEDQMGSMITLSKNGCQEQLLFSVNGNYSLWKWTT